MVRKIIVVIIITIAFFQLNAQVRTPSYKLGIKGMEEVQIRSDFDDFDISQFEIFDGKIFCLIQFWELPSAEQHTCLEQNGIILSKYIHGNAYFASIPVSFDFQVIEKMVRAIMPVNRSFKTIMDFTQFKKNPDSNQIGVCILFKGVDQNKVQEDLKMRKVFSCMEYTGKGKFQFDPRPDLLNRLVLLPYIEFVTVIENDTVKGDILSDYKQANIGLSYFSTFNTGVYTGNSVGIGDSYYGYLYHNLNLCGPRFTEECTVYDQNVLHKIIVLEEMASAGNINQCVQGVARGADIWSLPVVFESQFASVIEDYYNDGLRYLNFSVGRNIPSQYNSNSQDADEIIDDFPIMFIYSGGNNAEQYGNGPYFSVEGFGTAEGDGKSSKNHIVVGAIDYFDNIITSYRHGPTNDGRIYPHVVAEGTGGTSFAAPKVTGLFAILTEAYRNINNVTEVDPQLIKTILLNTCDDLGNSGPDFYYGYGKPNLRRALEVIEDNFCLTGNISNGNQHNYNINVPVNCKQVRVLLSWPDPAAAVPCTLSIVNDLNLSITDPSNISYNPWVLDHTANATNLSAIATRQLDNRNVIEQVTVDNPTSGTWTINVDGYSVPSASQDYNISYEFLFDEVKVVFPNNGAKMIPESDYFIEWNSYGGIGAFLLYYKLDNGSWTYITEVTDTDARKYFWSTPQISSGVHKIQFKVQRGLTYDEGNDCYIGERPTSVTIDWKSEHHCKLSWKPYLGATNYKVYGYQIGSTTSNGSDYVMEIPSGDIDMDVTNAAAIIDCSSNSYSHFCVSAITGTYEGLRSFPRDFTDIPNAAQLRSIPPASVSKTSVTIRGLYNPHNEVISNAVFSFGTDVSMTNSTNNISVSASNHETELVTFALTPSPLANRDDELVYEIVDPSSHLFTEKTMYCRLAPGYQYDFTGTNNYINLGSDGLITSDDERSICVWAKVSQFGGGTLFEAGNARDADFGEGISYDSSNKRLKLRTNSTTDSWTLDLGNTLYTFSLPGSFNKWRHYCLTYDGTFLKFYFDGELMYTLTVELNTKDGMPIKIGGNLIGSVDEFSYWNIVLNQTDIRAMMHNPLKGTETGLIHYLNFDQDGENVYNVIPKWYDVGNIGTISVSSCPFGVGTSRTATEASGIVELSNTGLQFNFQTQTGSTLHTARIDIEPNSFDGITYRDGELDNQYWIIHKLGTGSVETSISFSLSDSQVSLVESNTNCYHLYSRECYSDNLWEFVDYASSVDVANNNITFSGLTDIDKQFFIAKTNYQIISLPQGWSMFSSYLDNQESVADVCNDILTNLEIVKDGNGQVYWPLYSLDQIGDLAIGKSYEIKMANADNLTIFGNVLDPTNNVISLPSGWSYLGYIRTASGNLEEMLSSVLTNVEIVQDEAGNSYWPQYYIHDLSVLEPGKGYKIKMFGSDDLTYPANTSKGTTSKNKTLMAPEFFSQPIMTDNNLILCIPLTSWLWLPQTGDEVAIVDSSGTVVGLRVFEGQNLSIPIWGDDDLTMAEEGLQSTEEFYIKLYQPSNTEVLDVNVNTWIVGNNHYLKDSLFVVGQLAPRASKGSVSYLAEQFSSSLNLFPNPTSGYFTISFFVPMKDNFEIEVLSPSGQQVELVTSKILSVGPHEMQISVPGLSVGNYMIRIRSSYINIVRAFEKQ